MGRLTRLILAGALWCHSSQAASSEWVVARNPHFEVYSQAGPERAKVALAWFEDLRRFFDRNGIIPGGLAQEPRLPIKVIGFSSEKEYSPFKLRATADAFYTGSEDGDYIVMPDLGPGEFKVAAHEYAHYVLRSSGLKLPVWLSEGLAEVFSTITITGGRSEFGGDIPVHTAALRPRAWLSAAELLAAVSDSPPFATRDGAGFFYAESWALTNMLVFSPEYAPNFRGLISVIGSGESSPLALQDIYRKAPEAILGDAREWLGHARSSTRALAAASGTFGVAEVSGLSEVEANTVLAQLLAAIGERDRAEKLFHDVLQKSPSDSGVLAALGAIALRKGDREKAIEYWREAIDRGGQDANLCYRYSVLADEAGLPSEEIERALVRAIASKPDFDDARYRLALLKSNAGEYGAAVAQLRSMVKPPAERAFSYWAVMAYALSELGNQGEADSAAREAMRLARTADERARAAELAYVAKTELAVRFARDANGQLQLVTTRVPKGSTDWNPFIEPGDRIQAAKVKLREVRCSEGRLTGFVVETDGGSLVLSVPDPAHVLMRNAPAEFNCGPQSGKDVKAEYAAGANGGADVLRGMEFP